MARTKSSEKRAYIFFTRDGNIVKKPLCRTDREAIELAMKEARLQKQDIFIWRAIGTAYYMPNQEEK